MAFGNLTCVQSPLRASVSMATLILMLLSTTHSYFDGKRWSSEIKPGRSIVRSEHGMVASSQPLASQVGLEVLKRGGNAVDAAIAMAAVLNVTEPMMTGIGGDMFALVYWSKTGELKGLNASGRAPRALNLDYFTKKGIKTMPDSGMEPITVPGAFDGWVTLLEKYGTMKLSELADARNRVRGERLSGDGEGGGGLGGLSREAQEDSRCILELPG